MSKVSNFTEGKIFSPLLKFAIPILLALFLQTMYGAVDLLIVGQFGNAADVSAVSTGSQVMMTITVIITGLTMGLTILIGQKLGEGNSKEAGNVVGSGISIFAIIAIVITVLIVRFASPISTFMHTPKEAFDSTVMYIKVCASGSIFIVAYNIIGGVFRGLGDSKTPLITVGIACVTNIIGDLIFVGIFKMAATGAALATIMAQAISVILSVIIIKKRGLPFEFSRKSIKFHKGLTSKIIKYGYFNSFTRWTCAFIFPCNYDYREFNGSNSFSRNWSCGKTCWIYNAYTIIFLSSSICVCCTKLWS